STYVSPLPGTRTLTACRSSARSTMPGASARVVAHTRVECWARPTTTAPSTVAAKTSTMPAITRGFSHPGVRPRPDDADEATTRDMVPYPGRLRALGRRACG